MSAAAGIDEHRIVDDCERVLRRVLVVAVEDIVLEDVVCALGQFVLHFSIHVENIVVEMCAFCTTIPIRIKHGIYISLFGHIKQLL